MGSIGEGSPAGNMVSSSDRQSEELVSVELALVGLSRKKALEPIYFLIANRIKTASVNLK